MRKSITKEQLTQVAQRLGGWKYHDILSNDAHEHGHWLSIGAGQFITINYAYGESLPQWSLKYVHPKYKHRITFLSIGCSLDKSLNAIVTDVNNRLLSSMQDLFTKLQEDTETLTKEQNKQEYEAHMINALGRVLRLNEVHDHRFAKSFRIEKPQGERVATMKKWSNRSDFELTIDCVTPEQIIKIMSMIEGSALK